MVGTDIIEVSRIEKLIKEKGDKFLNKIYTKNEIDYCESKGPNKYQHYAGRFAAKEAVFKVIESNRSNNDDFGLLIFKDIQILNNDDGSSSAVCATIKCDAKWSRFIRDFIKQKNKMNRAQYY